MQIMPQTFCFCEGKKPKIPSGQRASNCMFEGNTRLRPSSTEAAVVWGGFALCNQVHAAEAWEDLHVNWRYRILQHKKSKCEQL